MSTNETVKKESDPCPFQKSQSKDRRLKLFLWGSYGVGKTPLALQFPKPAVIDLERGTIPYRGIYEFEDLQTTTSDEVMACVEWLLTHSHEYRTLVIDPITVYWESLQKKWSDIFLKRNKGSKGFKFEFYDLQAKDWNTIKLEFKEFIRKLLSLDMNVIVTAREKTKYAEGGFMKAIGETFDGEKSLPYLFDTIVRLYTDENERIMGVCERDRTCRLKKNEPFECSIKVFEEAWGEQSLRREAKPIAYATSEQKSQIRELIQKIRITPAQVTASLSAYNADSLDELTEVNAITIFEKLTQTLKNKNQNEAQPKGGQNASH